MDQLWTTENHSQKNVATFRPGVAVKTEPWTGIITGSAESVIGYRTHPAQHQVCQARLLQEQRRISGSNASTARRVHLQERRQPNVSSQSSTSINWSTPLSTPQRIFTTIRSRPGQGHSKHNVAVQWAVLATNHCYFKPLNACSLRVKNSHSLYLANTHRSRVTVTLWFHRPSSISNPYPGPTHLMFHESYQEDYATCPNVKIQQ